MPKYKILKLKADKIINMGLIAPITKDDYTITYKINLEHTSMYELVVDEQLVMDNCALFDQFKLYLDKDDTEEENHIETNTYDNIVLYKYSISNIEYKINSDTELILRMYRN